MKLPRLVTRRRLAVILNVPGPTAMKTLVSLIRLRHSVIVRAMAGSPVTAPFAAFDLADLGGDAPLHGDPLSSSKVPNQALAAAVASETLTPPFIVVDLPPGPTAGPVGARQVLQRVLRL
jgi:hypothetical protein